ncbi:MAG: hypothetical protein FD145_686 [Candidatus Saganbacteria bacterium]|uniref:Uncharacterized protein n=1 Tax=Candidatus Saganbacteria bacterium TaxID=2575572 RepID=A0A833P3B9_UNCSA|nr:MAG: hypothetical protein FD145_686 [Candidatus Saganbacteria bacterium]
MGRGFKTKLKRRPDFPPLRRTSRKKGAVAAQGSAVGFDKIAFHTLIITEKRPSESEDNYYLARNLLIISELVTTETELKAMAAPAIIGFKRKPVKGYKIPAAMGTPNAL